LDAVRDRLNLSERAKALFRLHRKWRPIAVGYERYGMMADIEYLHEEQRRQNYRFSIIELGGRLAKEERVRRLIPIFEQGRFFLPDKLWYRTLDGRPIDLTRVIVDELLSFPVSEHDDAVDSISRIMDAELETFFPAPAQKRIEDRYARRRLSRAQRFGCSHWAM
jgi:phage terminase large subunit-like protein